MTSSISYKQIVSFLLLLAFIAQTFSKELLIVNYYANSAAYARGCINKATPKMNCNGKCQLAKKLKQEENRDKQNPERKKNDKNEVFLSFINQYEMLRFNTLVITSYPSYKNINTNIMAFDFFQPPRV